MKKIIILTLAALTVVIFAYGLGHVVNVLFPASHMENPLYVGMMIIVSFCGSFAFFAFLAKESEALK